MEDTDDEYVSVPEAAKELGITPPSLHKILDKGRIPYIRPLSHRRVKLADVLAYRNRRTARGRQKVATVGADDPLAD